MSRFTTPPTLADIEEMAEAALATIPRAFLDPIGNVLIRVDDFPDEEVEREMELETPFDLLGLYQGIGMPYRSVTAPLQHMDVIHLYRRPILDYWCESGEDLVHVVRHVLIHEIGHHLGFSDEDMDAIENGTFGN